MAKKKTHPLVEGLIKLDGRMMRSEFWLLSIGLGVIRAVIFLLIALLLGFERNKPIIALVGGLLSLLFLWPSLALMVKRGHDRNRATAYSIVLVAITTVAPLALSLLQPGDLPRTVVALTYVLLQVYCFIDYGCLDGTQGSNRYGRSPKGIGGDPDSKLADVFA